MARLRDWRADVVLTLVEPAEMAALGVAGLPLLVQGAGAIWRHFPIEDYGVPEAGDWPALSEELRGGLVQGARVIIHCRGGCGRTGMIALRLMLEAGEAPGAALARLRVARPCAIETEAQMDWALAGRVTP